MRPFYICIVSLSSLLLAARASAQVQPPAAAAAPKWCRQVTHQPQQPKPGERVTINATIADDVTDVRLEYQLVNPGAYVELKDPAYSKGWTSEPMKKTGEVHIAELPESLQKHRRIVRYRIVAKDK